MLGDNPFIKKGSKFPWLPKLTSRAASARIGKLTATLEVISSGDKDRILVDGWRTKDEDSSAQSGTV